MIEIRDSASWQATYGKYIALIEVDGRRLFPCDFFPTYEGVVKMMGYRYLLTSQTGTNPNPDATTLYTAASAWGEYDDFDIADFDNIIEYGCDGVCTLAEAQAWLAANGTPKEIVYQDE